MAMWTGSPPGSARRASRETVCIDTRGTTAAWPAHQDRMESATEKVQEKRHKQDS